MTKYLAATVLLCACATSAQLLERLADTKGKRSALPKGELKVSAEYMSGNRATGELLATGNVSAAAAPYRFHSNRVQRTVDGIYSFGEDARMTTCSNHVEHLHWELDGDFTFIQDEAVLVKNAWLKYYDVPVFWVPYWYYPLNTDYGLRVLPGYRSRWGGFLLTKYVYDLVNDGKPDAYSLGASTYADYRTKNGFGVGQSVRWNLQDFGKGKISAYNAWDEDYDRYMRRNWSGHHRNYRNWGSDVERQRYRVVLDHGAELTERDDLHVHAVYLSDSHVNRDFFDKDNRLESIPANEAWYEHHELSWAAGGSVSGPVNDFYGGTARLPEGWLSVEPQPVWDLPVNYESQTRAGYLNHDYARYGSHDPMYRYVPYIGTNGRGADYQAFRMDTAHRLTIPFKLGDMFSVVPRAGYRGTYWSDSGDRDSDYLKASGDGLFRHICEVGATASARGSGWWSDRVRHTIEPYLDYSFQDVELSEGRGRRYYAFDNYDRSTDWLDQFGFEGRGLPYNWHGIRPGIRNMIQQMDDAGVLRTLLDWDIYAAVPFETMTPYREGVLAGYPDRDEDANYSRSGHRQVVPGTRIRWNPARDISFLTRAEYDCQNSKAAYADIVFRHRLSDSFSYHVSYIGRDQRIWGYLPSEYRRWNYEYSNIIQVGFTHDVCDWFAWSPYIRFDCRANETDEVGAWFDLMSDCLGYRFQFAHETSYRRVDGSKEACDNRVMFFIYLRALGPGSMLDLARF